MCKEGNYGRKQKLYDGRQCRNLLFRAARRRADPASRRLDRRRGKRNGDGRRPQRQRRRRLSEIRARNRSARRPRSGRRKNQLLRLFRRAKPHLYPCSDLSYDFCPLAGYGRGQSRAGACPRQSLGRFQRRHFRRAFRQNQVQERQQVFAVAEDVRRGNPVVGHPAVRDTCGHLGSGSACVARNRVSHSRLRLHPLRRSDTRLHNRVDRQLRRARKNAFRKKHLRHGGQRNCQPAGNGARQPEGGRLVSLCGNHRRSHSFRHNAPLLLQRQRTRRRHSSRRKFHRKENVPISVLQQISPHLLHCVPVLVGMQRARFVAALYVVLCL